MGGKQGSECSLLARLWSMCVIHHQQHVVLCFALLCCVERWHYLWGLFEYLMLWLIVSAYLLELLQAIRAGLCQWQC